MAIKSYLKDGKKLFMVEVKTRDQNGKQIYRSKQGITSERKAQEAEFELKKELELITKRISTHTWISWYEHCMSQMKHEVKVSTVSNYQSILEKWVNPEWKFKHLESITKADVYNLVFEKFDQNKSDYSKRNLLKMIGRMFRMAVNDGIVDRDPTTGIRIKIQDTDLQVLTAGEVEKLLTEAQKENHRFYSVWVTALWTGMRSGELMALLWSDINFDSKTISVTKQWTNKDGITDIKTYSSRVVPISAELEIFLKELRLRSTTPEVLPRLSEWYHGDQAKILGNYCESIGIRRVRFHDLRATFITNLLSKGVALARVMAMVGHAELKTTNCYLRKAGIDLQGATEELSYSMPKERPMARVVALVR
ncbi:MAG: site-specific integrase [Bdellovibrionaceae bacterium]|nr:site-specific integrase [Pseudobdellovibrionaceae bacterium]